MPVRLSTTISKISLLANSTNQMLVTEFYEYMKNNGCSEKHINNNLKAIMNFADNLEPKTTFFDIRRKDQILIFLDIKIKTIEEDPDGKWITTWNHYLSHIKYFFKWLHNIYNNRNFQNGVIDNTITYPLAYDDWKTPGFIQIKKKKTKRLSPYLETELWEREELLCILKYEPSKRNKLPLALFWDNASSNRCLNSASS